MHPEWQTQIAAYLSSLRAAGSSPGTIKVRHKYLLRLAAANPDGPWTASPDNLIDFMQHPDWAPETRKSARSALRGFYGWALETGRIDNDPARFLPSVSVPPGKPRPTPETVLEDALNGASPRVRVMLMLAAYAGLRRAEIASLHTRALVGDTLRIKGKGGKVRTVPIVNAELLAALEQTEPGFVFPGRDHGHASPDWIGRQIGHALAPGWTAHTLRHRFASRAYTSQRDLLSVQQLLGHSKPETTARYTAVPDGALRAAVEAAS